VASAGAVDRLHAFHERMEADLPVVAGDARLAEAVGFLGNCQRPVHRWFRYKESFGIGLLDALGVDTRPLHSEGTAFVDPFCGVGTTILAGDLQHGWRALRVGVEVNPFIAFAARVKADWREFNAARVRRCVAQVLNEPLRTDISSENWPALSTLRDARLFPPDRVSQLVDAVNRVGALDKPERELLLLGVAASAEEVGFYRKDGRALRILDSEPLISERRTLTVERALRRTWAQYEADLTALNKSSLGPPGPHQIIEGDGRGLATAGPDLLADRSVALMAYSPPYLNHIDYTEVYKVELWLLGYVAKKEEMLGLRRRTFRSHASVIFEDRNEELPANVAEAIAMVCDEVEQSKNKWHARLRPVAIGYACDLQQSLRRQYQILAPGGQIVCVIGNSSHGRAEHKATIPADLWFSHIARAVGFEVEKFVVARQLRRRGKDCRFLRETAIVLRRES
jgi:hypothetical protein